MRKICLKILQDLFAKHIFHIPFWQILYLIFYMGYNIFLLKEKKRRVCNWIIYNPIKNVSFSDIPFAKLITRQIYTQILENFLKLSSHHDFITTNTTTTQVSPSISHEITSSFALFAYMLTSFRVLKTQTFTPLE